MEKNAVETGYANTPLYYATGDLSRPNINVTGAAGGGGSPWPLVVGVAGLVLALIVFLRR